MNKHDFGFSHSKVKEKIKEFGEHGNKIKGRVMAFTPNDIHDILAEKDKSHVGIVTSGHNFPGKGILLSPKNPNDREGTKTIFILKNFPESVKEFLNGSDIPVDTVTKKLNQYTREYNNTVQDVRNKIEQKQPITVTEYYMLKDPKGDGGPANRMKTGEHDTILFENGKWHLVHHSPHGISDIKSQKDQERKEFLKSKKQTKELDQQISEAEDVDSVHKIKLDSDIDLDLKTFDRLNPISKEFTTDQILELAKHLKDKMCCVGGNCYTCTTKCGAKGCEPDKNKKTKEDITESIKKFKNFVGYNTDEINYMHY